MVVLRLLHRLGHRGVDERLDLGNGAKARRQVLGSSTYGDELLLHALIKGDIGTPETVDGLLGIGDDEELAGFGPDATPVVLDRVVGAQEQQDLGLDRVRVLKLVDEQMCELVL
jgi:hypothetical protein